MAYLNGLYIHVTDEDMDEDIEVSEHPVEQGADVADHVNIKGARISLSGKIVKADGLEGHEILTKIKAWRDTKTLLRYDGRNYGNNLLITKFTTGHPKNVKGGCTFSMELRNLPIAKNAYVADEQQQPETVTEQPTKEAIAEGKIAVGEIVVFKGGSVYASSDAKNKTSTRNRSTCKITIIAKNSWSIHKLHLVSTDGGKVYGWVDESNIEGVKAENTETKKQTDAGRQQISKGG